MCYWWLLHSLIWPESDWLDSGAGWGCTPVVHEQSWHPGWTSYHSHHSQERATVMATHNICSAYYVSPSPMNAFFNATSTCVGGPQQKPLRWRVRAESQLSHCNFWIKVHSKTSIVHAYMHTTWYDRHTLVDQQLFSQVPVVVLGIHWYPAVL